MGMFRVLNEHVVSEAEFRRRALDFDPLSAAKQGLSLEFSGGKAVALDNIALKSLVAAAPPPVGFEPIGRGRPLTVMIREVYTGRYPKGGLFGSHKDVAIVSGVKNYDVFNASARALNFISTGLGPKSRTKMPTAFSEGTSLIAYSPAVLTDSQIVTVEFAIDSFPNELFEKISAAFTNLAGIPILLPYAGYLMGAAGVVKLAGNLGEALFDGRPAFNVTQSIDFGIPGLPVAEATYRILTTDDFDASAYQYDPQKGLVDAGGQVYKGDSPYVVISLDGKENKDLDKFRPTVASAAVLQRFFQMKDGGEAAVDAIVTGVQLVSDLRYREKALQLKAQIEAAAAGTDTSALKADYAAVLKNISNDVLKPK